MATPVNHQAILSEVIQIAPHLINLPTDKLWVDYDREADVLYISFQKPQRATDSELLDNGILLRYRGKHLVGITIFEASKKYRVANSQTALIKSHYIKTIVKIDENSQITLPDMFFEALQLGPENEFIAEVTNGQIILTPKTDTELILESPPTKNIDEIITQMRATGRYSEEFLSSLKDGMLDSRYFSESAEDRKK